MKLVATIRCRRDRFELEAEVECGEEICAIVGANGSGKTTLLDAISGELPIIAGRIALGDRVLADAERGIALPSRERSTIRVYQGGRLFPHLDVRGNLDFKRADRHRLDYDEVVDTLRLRDLLGRRPAQLSAGERQRVALGRAFLAAGEALLLDEALNAIDHALRAQLLQAIPAWRRQLGVPLLFVSHATDEVEQLADRIVRLDGGSKL